MKLNTRSVKMKKGMTLIELTVVILVLLSLISILFIGARAYKRGSDRAGCVLNIRNVQQAVRSHQNMYNKQPAGSAAPDSFVLTTDIYSAPGEERYMNEPHCPTDNSAYAAGDDGAQYPEVGNLAIECATTDAAIRATHEPDSDKPVAERHTDW